MAGRSGLSVYPSERLLVLDALRGIAALVVVVAHALQLFYGYEQPILHGIGRFGVVVFFLVSGYVIPTSFARHASQRTFWIRRLCRLFPLYWLTIGIAAIFKGAGWLPQTPLYQARLNTTYLLNLTMVPNFFNVPSVLSVFWSMHIEVLFYVVVAVVGLLGLQHKTMLVGLLLVLITLASAFVPGIGFTLYYPLFLTIIWCGAVLQRSHTAGESLIKVAPFLLVTLMLVGLGEGSTILGRTHATATVAAFAFVLVALHRPAWLQQRVLGWLGSISYSLYLLHLLVLAVVPMVGPPVLSMVVWLALMLLVAAATERWIERPSIALGKHLSATRSKPVTVVQHAPVLNT